MDIIQIFYLRIHENWNAISSMILLRDKSTRNETCCVIQEIRFNKENE